jgi:hypothetical protein
LYFVIPIIIKLSQRQPAIQSVAILVRAKMYRWESKRCILRSVYSISHVTARMSLKTTIFLRFTPFRAIYYYFSLNLTFLGWPHLTRDACTDDACLRQLAKLPVKFCNCGLLIHILVEITIQTYIFFSDAIFIDI